MNCLGIMPFFKKKKKSPGKSVDRYNENNDNGEVYGHDCNVSDFFLPGVQVHLILLQEIILYIQVFNSVFMFRCENSSMFKKRLFSLISTFNC